MCSVHTCSSLVLQCAVYTPVLLSFCNFQCAHLYFSGSALCSVHTCTSQVLQCAVYIPRVVNYGGGGVCARANINSSMTAGKRMPPKPAAAIILIHWESLLVVATKGSARREIDSLLRNAGQGCAAFTNLKSYKLSFCWSNVNKNAQRFT